MLPNFFSGPDWLTEDISFFSYQIVSSDSLVITSGRISRPQDFELNTESNDAKHSAC